MMRLKSKLLSLNADKNDKDKIKVYSPKNCEELRIPFKADKVAKVVGKLAQLPPPSSSSSYSTSKMDDGSRFVTGVLVQNDFKMSLMAPEDLREFAGLTTTTITCRQRMTLSAAGIDLVRWALESTFGAIEEIFEGYQGDDPDAQRMSSGGQVMTNGNGPSSSSPAESRDDQSNQMTTTTTTSSYLVMGCIVVRHRKRGEVEIEWEGNMLNDGIADAVMAVLYAAESSPAAVKRTSHPRDELYSLGAADSDPWTCH